MALLRAAGQFHRLARRRLHLRAGAAGTQLLTDQVLTDQHLRFHRIGLVRFCRDGNSIRAALARIRLLFVDQRRNRHRVPGRDVCQAVVQVGINIEVGFIGVQRIGMLGWRNHSAQRQRFARLNRQRQFMMRFAGTHARSQSRTHQRRGADKVFKFIHFRRHFFSQDGIVAQRGFTDGDRIPELEFLLAHRLAVDVGSRA